MFGPDIIAAIRQHAIVEFPKESCGFVTPDGYRPCRNVAENPEADFAISPEEYLAAGTVLAVVHSHPNGPVFPSAFDMRGQIDMAVPWGLVATNGEIASVPFFWGDGVPIPPLVGRDFRHGPSGTDGLGDCYAVIKDGFAVGRGGMAAQGVTGHWPFDPIGLPEFPRDDEWWTKGGDLYRDGFQVAGFSRIGIEDARPGDVFLAQIRSPVPNHGGLYLGDGLILHHLASRLSRREPIGGWLKYVVMVLRYA